MTIVPLSPQPFLLGNLEPGEALRICKPDASSDLTDLFILTKRKPTYSGIEHATLIRLSDGLVIDMPSTTEVYRVAAVVSDPGV